MCVCVSSEDERGLMMEGSRKVEVESGVWEGRGHPSVARSWGVGVGGWWGALCYLLEALLVPGLSVHTIGGDLPPVGNVLADLGAVAVPLPPLAIRLRCREAHLVLLQDDGQRFSARTPTHGR